MTTCSITSCNLAAAGCGAAYTGTNVKVVSNKEVHGKQNVAAGYEETVCLRCSDSSAGSINKDNLKLKQAQEECNYQLKATAPTITPLTYVAPVQGCGIDESKNTAGPNKCTEDSHCQGARTCSTTSVCAGTSGCPYTEWKKIMDPGAFWSTTTSACGITKCELLVQGCATAYSGDKLKVLSSPAVAGDPVVKESGKYCSSSNAANAGIQLSF